MTIPLGYKIYQLFKSLVIKCMCMISNTIFYWITQSFIEMTFRINFKIKYNIKKLKLSSSKTKISLYMN